MEPSTPHAPTAVGRSCSNMRPMTATVRTGHTSVIFSAVRRAIFYVILERFSVRSFRLGCFLHWRSLGAIHRRNLETGPRHRPRRSWRPSPYGGKALGRVTFTADGRMMSVVCDAGKSCRPECAGNIAPTAATTPVMARSLSPRLTRPQTRAVDTWGRFLFRVGSRSAPIETPTSGVFSGDFSYLLQFGRGPASVLIHRRTRRSWAAAPGAISTKMSKQHHTELFRKTAAQLHRSRLTARRRVNRHRRIPGRNL